MSDVELTADEIERHVCCLKRQHCREDHFHQRDVERIIAARTPIPADRAEDEAVAALLTEPCYVTRSATVRCSGFVGGKFSNGADWTESMCCYPCRVVAALSAATPEGGATNDH